MKPVTAATILPPDGNAPRYGFIDGLKGIAILLVIAVHAAQLAAPAISVELKQAFGFGARGVPLFFLISGFILCVAYEKIVASRFARQSLVFYIRRFFRIVPLFWCALLVFFLLQGFAPRYWAPDGLQPKHFLLGATFTFGLQPYTNNSLVPGSWSIGNEFYFSLLFPFLYGLLLRRMHLSFVFAFACVLTLCSSLFAADYTAGLHHMFAGQPPYLIASYALYSFPAHLQGFVWGIVCYRLYADARTQRLYAQLKNNRGAYALALLLATFLWWKLQHGLRVYFSDLSAFYLTIVPLLFVASLGPGDPVLQNRALRWLGTLSYSLYFNHFIIVELLQRAGYGDWLATHTSGWFALLPTWALLTALSATLSYFTHALLEQRFADWGARVGKKLKNA